jgi:two-component system, OmpR family, response regulator
MTKRRILIVDDDLTCSRILKAGLERVGYYDVQTENHATRALSSAQEFRPDLVLLDVCMIDGDGGEVAFRLRNDKQFHNIPIIFLTSIVSEHEAQNGNAIRGTFPFLAKPVRLEKVIDCIERHIGTGKPDSQLPIERISR